MDHTLRRYQRAFESDPHDIAAAHRYIAYLERALHEEQYKETPYELDYNVMRYRPRPGEFSVRVLSELRENAAYFAAEYGSIDEVDENDFIISIFSILTVLDERGRRRHNLVNVAKRARKAGYKHIQINIDPEIHISENYRRMLANRGLSGTLSGLRKEARELETFLETWRPRHPDSYSNFDIEQTALYRYLLLPKERSAGFSPEGALKRARKVIEETWQQQHED